MELCDGLLVFCMVGVQSKLNLEGMSQSSSTIPYSIGLTLRHRVLGLNLQDLMVSSRIEIKMI